MLDIIGLSFGILNVGVVTYISKLGSTLFSWHPVLMLLSALIFTYLGINALNKNSQILKNKSKLFKVRLHEILLLVGFTCMLVGFLVIYVNKNINNKPHFQTWHGLFGIITLIYMATQIIGGFALWFNVLKKFLTYKTLKCAHLLSGSLFYILVTVTIIMGFNSIWFKNNLNNFYLSSFMIFAVVFNCALIFRQIYAYVGDYFKCILYNN